MRGVYRCVAPRNRGESALEFLERFPTERVAQFGGIEGVPAVMTGPIEDKHNQLFPGGLACQHGLPRVNLLSAVAV